MGKAGDGVALTEALLIGQSIITSVRPASTLGDSHVRVWFLIGELLFAGKWKSVLYLQAAFIKSSCSVSLSGLKVGYMFLNVKILFLNHSQETRSNFKELFILKSYIILKYPH